MSNAVSARIDQLNVPLLRSSEKHGRRLDESSQARKVRDEPSIAWSPHPGDAFALVDRLADHVAGAHVPASATKALHLVVKLPDSVPVASMTDAARAMALAVEFAQETFGGAAVFAARIDRDERSLNVVDLFLAPRYLKVTKRASKPAVAMTRHLKMLAEKHGREADGGGARGTMIAQGRALQDELAAWLTARGFEAVRGQPKDTPGRDWESPEVIGAKHDREAAEAALRAAEDLRTANEARSRQMDDRERDLRAREATLKRETARQAARDREVSNARTAVEILVERATDRDDALDRREAGVADREKEVGRQAGVLDRLIRSLEPVLVAVQRGHDRLARAPEQVRRWLDADRQAGAAVKTAPRLIEQARAAARERGPSATPQPTAGDDVDLATLTAVRDAGAGRG